MRIKKKINHNAILVIDCGVEKVIMGKGIGFSAVEGEIFDEDQVDKSFTLDTKEKTKLFIELTKQIPLEYIDFAEELILFIQEDVNVPLDSNIYITLTDHIYFAIQRDSEGEHATAIKLYEMKIFYPKEYDIAEKVVQKINQRYNTNLGIDEVGFITMHIINAELGEKSSLNGLKILEVSSYIINLVEIKFKESLDEESLAYNRLMIHVKFLVTRLVYNEQPISGQLDFVTKQFKNSEEYKISKEISKEIEKKYNLRMELNETVYLAIHLARLNNNI